MTSAKTGGFFLLLVLVLVSLPGCVTVGEDTPAEGATVPVEVSVVNNHTVERSLSITVTESEGILKQTVFSEDISVGAGTSETIDTEFKEGSYDVVVRTDDQLVSRYSWYLNDAPSTPVSDHLAVIHRGGRLNIAQRLEPRGINIQNRGNTSRRFDVSVVDSDDRRVVLSTNVTVSPDARYEIENVTSLEGTYNITVRTDDGLKDEYSWRVGSYYHDAIIVHGGDELVLTQSVQ